MTADGLTLVHDYHAAEELVIIAEWSQEHRHTSTLMLVLVMVSAQSALQHVMVAGSTSRHSTVLVLVLSTGH